MMLKVAKLCIAIAVLATLIVPAAYAGVPDISQSYFVPQSGSTGAPCEGAVVHSMACVASLPRHGALDENVRVCTKCNGRINHPGSSFVN